MNNFRLICYVIFFAAVVQNANAVSLNVTEQQFYQSLCDAPENKLPTNDVDAMHERMLGYFQHFCSQFIPAVTTKLQELESSQTEYQKVHVAFYQRKDSKFTLRVEGNNCDYICLNDLPQHPEYIVGGRAAKYWSAPFIYIQFEKIGEELVTSNMKFEMMSLKKFNMTEPFTHLRILQLPHNNLSRIQIQAPELTSLNLGQNRFSKFSVTNLPKLEILFLPFNGLENFGGTYASLDTLDLRFNGNVTVSQKTLDFIRALPNTQYPESDFTTDLELVVQTSK